jgi:tetratricopeptide (TPR) repeat protein
LYSNPASYEQTASTQDNGQALFSIVPVGDYQVEARAPGYEAGSESLSLLSPGAAAYVYVDLRPQGPAGAAVSATSPPALPLNAQRELDAAAAALRSADLTKAHDHVTKAQKMAPGHPEVYFLEGLLEIQKNRPEQARAALERAVGIYSDHAGAQSALGALLYRQSEFKAAIAALEKTVQLQPLAWQAHRTLALCYLHENALEKARPLAERALEIAGEKAPELHVFFARILIALREKEKARQELQFFLAHYPGRAEAAEAKRLLATSLEDAGAAAQSDSRAQSSATDGQAKGDFISYGPGMEFALSASRPGVGRWAPPAVDETLPAVVGQAACSVESVLAGAARRATALAENLERVTANERIEHSEIDRKGRSRKTQSIQFDYFVSIVETRPGNLAVEEDRIPLHRSATSLPYMTNGLGALALIFHPYYAKDYDVRCEGLTEVNGKPAWSVYFRQRADVPSRVRSYRFREGSFSVALKGRALIAANNFQVLRLETDLVQPVKPLRLEQEHLVIEYKPVDFKSRKIRLWLPANAELYASFRGRRIFHHHAFTEYKVFTVDVTQKISGEKP